MAIDVDFPGNIASVSTAADLRALPSGSFVDADFYNVRNLGFFSWSPTSVSVDDGRTVIKPNDRTPLQAGRWLFGAIGTAGPSNNTRVDLAALKIAQISDKSSLYDGSLWIFSTANAPYVADDKNIVKADSTPLSVGAWVRQPGGYQVQAEAFGLSTAGTPAGNAQALLSAILALRTSGTMLSTDGLNGGAFTAYASGELLVGEGVFPIAPDVLKITQDLGLVIKGKGSRKTNNAVVGRTVLLITGASNGFGIQTQGNGARGLVLEDLDLCYAGSSFTGDVLDNFGSPGMVLNRCHLGTHGITGSTRLQTARSLVRSTYGEFIHALDTTFDGAVDGVWFDQLRQPPTGPTNEFGGSGMLLTSCVFYDLSGSMVRSDGQRNLKKLSLRDTSFNPIAVNCTHALKLDNVDALAIEGCLFSPSVGNIPTGGWLNLTNCTGSGESNEFLGNCDLTVSTGLDGHMDWSNNFIDANQGFILKGGIFTGAGNEFSRCAAGFKSSAELTRPLCMRLGPNLFKADVSYSYDIATDSTLLDGFIDYVAPLDSSPNRFRNVSGRIAIRNGSEQRITIASTPYNVLRSDTGYRIELTATDAVANLPAVTNPGLRYTFYTNGTNTFTIAAPAGTLLVGGGGPKTSMTTGGDSGTYITVENFAGVWNVIAQRGAATYA